MSMTRRSFFKLPLLGIGATAALTQCETSPAAVKPAEVFRVIPKYQPFEVSIIPSMARLFYVPVEKNPHNQIRVLDQGELRHPLPNEAFVIENIRMRPPYRDEEADRWQIGMPRSWRYQAEFMALQEIMGGDFTRVLKNRWGIKPRTYLARSAVMVTHPQWAEEERRHLVNPKVLQLQNVPLMPVHFSEALLMTAPNAHLLNNPVPKGVQA